MWIKISHWLGVWQNHKLAAQCFLDAAQQDYAPASYHLGYINRRGIGVSQDLEKAALNNLGYLYQYGLGVPQVLPRAAQFFKASSDLGNSVASINLYNPLKK